MYEKTHHNITVRKFAAKYSDIVSYNIYRYSLKDFNFLTELEKPVLIGEFHFGTGSHGVWGTGLRLQIVWNNSQGCMNNLFTKLQNILALLVHTGFNGLINLRQEDLMAKTLELVLFQSLTSLIKIN